MNRRNLLKAAPAALLAGAVPATAAMAESPVRALFREWRAHNDWMNGPANKGLSDDEFRDLCVDDMKIVERMVSVPARDLADLCLKLLALTEMGSEVMYEGVPGTGLLPAEARALIGA